MCYDLNEYDPFEPYPMDYDIYDEWFIDNEPMSVDDWDSWLETMENNK